jgi:hypothetical protein
MRESIGMTARLGSTVQRTLSGVAGERTGLPGAETHEACGQDFGDLVQSLRRCEVVRRASWHPHKLSQIRGMSRTENLRCGTLVVGGARAYSIANNRLCTNHLSSGRQIGLNVKIAMVIRDSNAD